MLIVRLICYTIGVGAGAIITDKCKLDNSLDSNSSDTADTQGKSFDLPQLTTALGCTSGLEFNAVLEKLWNAYGSFATLPHSDEQTPLHFIVQSVANDESTIATNVDHLHMYARSKGSQVDLSLRDQNGDNAWNIAKRKNLKTVPEAILSPLSSDLRRASVAELNAVLDKIWRVCGGINYPLNRDGQTPLQVIVQSGKNDAITVEKITHLLKYARQKGVQIDPNLRANIGKVSSKLNISLRLTSINLDQFAVSQHSHLRFLQLFIDGRGMYYVKICFLGPCAGSAAARHQYRRECLSYVRIRHGESKHLIIDYILPKQCCAHCCHVDLFYQTICQSNVSGNINIYEKYLIL